jgi:hypothetical protein
MKNIHVIPTDKPSRLQLEMNGKYHLENGQTIALKSFYNIYITSDEKIKEGVDQWYLDKFLNKPMNSGGAQYGEKQNVIILTTDQDLIADGVQAIDDKFLEWFVKNPSCEEVKIGQGYFKNNYDLSYKIIIPKEEPNPFELPKALPDDVFYQSLEEPKQETLEEAKQEQKQHLIDLMRLDEQGTLEEVSPMNNLLIDLKETKISVKESIDIIEDEFIRTQINIFVQKTLDSVIDRIENELLEKESKWQQEQCNKMYSEDEVLDLLYKRDLYLLNRDEEIDLELPDKWFEQFKKK